MAKDTPEKPEGDAADKARRKAPTIDLAAKEVGKTAPEAAKAGSAGTGAKPAASGDKKPAEPEPPRDHAQEPRPVESGSFVPLVVAAVLGGVLVALVVVLLARGGYFLPVKEEGPDLAAEIATLKDEVAALKSAGAQDNLAPVRAEVAALRKDVDALKAQPPETPADPQIQAALESLRSRVDTLARTVSASPATAQSGPSPVADDVAALRKDIDNLAMRVDETPREERVAELETKVAADSDALSSLETKVDAASATIERTAALAPSVAANALAAALQSGRPFEAELAALRALKVDPARLDALAPHAVSGLPTLANLRAEFEAKIAGVDLETPIPEGAGVVDRLMASARGLVAVRPAHPTEGSDPNAVVARIRGALEAGNLEAALSEWETLPPAVREATAAWQKDASARRDADALVAQLRAQALSALQDGH